MKVEPHLTVAELSQLIEKAKRPKLRQRLRIIRWAMLRGEDVRKILQMEFGVGRSLNAVYYLLHRLGYASLIP
jgi:hypothetical protein